MLFLARLCLVHKTRALEICVAVNMLRMSGLILILCRYLGRVWFSAHLRFGPRKRVVSEERCALHGRRSQELFRRPLPTLTSPAQFDLRSRQWGRTEGANSDLA